MNKPEITRKALLDAATELNNLLDPDPKIKTVAVKTEVLIEAVKVAADLLEDGDGITEATNDLLLTLGVELPEGIEIKGEDEPELETATDPDCIGEIKDTEPELEPEVEVFLEDLVSLAEEMNTVMNLDPAIDVSLAETELRAEIMVNCYDNDECQIYDTDEFSEAAWSTLSDLGVVPVGEVTKEEVADLSRPQTVTAKTEKATKAKKEKQPKKEKINKTKTETSPRYTRDDAVCDAIRKLCKTGATMKEIMAESDDIFVAQGGSSNPTATNVNAYVISGLVHFGVLVKTEGKYKLA